MSHGVEWLGRVNPKLPVGPRGEGERGGGPAVPAAGAYSIWVHIEKEGEPFYRVVHVIKRPFGGSAIEWDEAKEQVLGIAEALRTGQSFEGITLPVGLCAEVELAYHVAFEDMREFSKKVCRSVPYGTVVIGEELTGYSTRPRPPTFHRGGPTPSSSSYRGPVRSIMGVPEGEFDPDDGDLGRVTRMPPFSGGGSGPSVPFEDEDPQEKVEKRRKVKGLGGAEESEMSHGVEWLGRPQDKGPVGFRCRWYSDWGLSCGYNGVWYYMGNYKYTGLEPGNVLWDRYSGIYKRKHGGRGPRPDLGF